jgi:hypothetical protein
MKFNWGWGIGIFYSLFVISMLAVVYMTTFYKPDMVSDDYYRDEQIFQEQIDKSINSRNLEVQPKIEKVDNYLVFIFPEILENSTGEISFFRPSDERMDFKVDINLNSEFKQLVNLENVASGKWKIKLNWKKDSTEYYLEKDVFL